MATTAARCAPASPLQHVPSFTRLNFAISRDLDVWLIEKPLTFRFNVLHLLGRTYLLRSGTGIGEFALQYGGPRRGFFIGLSQANLNLVDRRPYGSFSSCNAP